MSIHPVLVETLEQLAAIATLPGLSPLNSEDFIHHAPDAHWIMVRDHSEIVGYYSLWWRNTPSYTNYQIGCIGHYVAQDEIAADQLQHACTQLKEQGCTMAIAPMNGNTWRQYRLLSERGTEPPFFLEPDNPDDWGDRFTNAGFTPLTHYSSALTTDLTRQDPRIEKVAQRMADLGIKIRSLNMQQFEDELHRIYQVSIVSFRNNFLYTSIAETEFIAQYSKVRPYIQPKLVLMAEHENQLIGFLFAVPDLLQVKRGESLNTIVIKTVAILPGRMYAGLGNLLVAQCQAIASQLGYQRAIHALMHESNNSRNLSNRYAQTIRRYTLFSQELSP